jgi:hypothetical protein
LRSNTGTMADQTTENGSHVRHHHGSQFQPPPRPRHRDGGGNTLKARPDAAVSSDSHAWTAPRHTVRGGDVNQCVKQRREGSARRGGCAAHDGAKPGMLEELGPGATLKLDGD